MKEIEGWMQLISGEIETGKKDASRESRVVYQEKGPGECRWSNRMM